MCLKKEEILINKIIHFLINSEVQEGDRLPPERELAELFHASRNTLRSAIKNLQARGILEVRPRSGYYLKTSINLRQQLIAPTNSDLETSRISEQLEAFYLFEPVIVEFAAQKINAARMADLDKHLVGLSKAILIGNTEMISKHHKVIYQHISQATENFIMVSWLEQVDTMFNSISKALVNISQSERGLIFAAHVNLVNSIKSHNCKDAAEKSKALITLLALILNKYEAIPISTSIPYDIDDINKQQN